MTLQFQDADTESFRHYVIINTESDYEIGGQCEVYSLFSHINVVSF